MFLRKMNAVIITVMLFAAGDCFSRSSRDKFKRLGRAERMRRKDAKVTAILDQMIFKSNQYIRPNYGGPPVDIAVSLYILSVNELSEMRMDFTSDLYLRQTWKDPRLAFEPVPGTEELTVPGDFINNIWKPDTFIVNEKKSRFHLATYRNEFLRIKYDGVATRSIRLTVTSGCQMNLRYFPMDRQLCNLEIESFGYTMKDILYRWDNSNERPISVDRAGDASLPQYTIVGFRQKDYDITISTGNYSRLKCEIQFERSFGYYVIQIYVPCILIVFVSWISCWLPRSAVTARAFLGVTTVLTITTLISLYQETMPKPLIYTLLCVSSVSSFVYWVTRILYYIFYSFDGFWRCRNYRLEKARVRDEWNLFPIIRTIAYALVGYAAKRISMKVKRFLEDYTNMVGQELRRRRSHRAGISETNIHIELEVVIPQYSNRSTENKVVLQICGHDIPRPTIPKEVERFLGTHPAEIDIFTRFVFPAGFVSFNIIYWTIVYYLSDSTLHDLTLVERK